MAAFRVWWQAIRYLNHRGYLYIWANILWALLTVLVITAPAAWAGLSRLGYVSLREPSVSMDDFWQGFRENFRRGLLLTLIGVIVVIVNVGNLWAYRFVEGPAAVFLRVIWIGALVLWFSLQFFVWPLFYAMERPTLLGAFRNAAVLMLQNPLFTFISLLLIGIIAALSTFFTPAWLLLTGSVFAVASNSLVLDRLRAAGFAQDVPVHDELPSDGGLPGDVTG